MALVTLRRNFCHLPDFRVCGALVALKSRPVNRMNKVVKGHQHPWFCSVQPKPVRVLIHPACGKKFHAENGTDHAPLGEQRFSQAHDWDGLDQSLRMEGEQVFYKRLDSLTSWEEVLSFVSTLETLPETWAAGALQRICEVGKGDDDQRLPKEIQEDSVFQALCFRLEQQPLRLSSTGLVTALQALILLHVDPQSSLVLNLVAECQNRLQAGVLEASDLCILGETLIRLQGPGCATLELIIHQLQGKKLETLTPEDIVAIYRILQTCSEKVDQHQTFLNVVNNFSLSVVSYLSPKSISQMLAALVVLDQTQAHPLIIKLGKYVVRHIPHFTNEELRKVLEAFIYFGVRDRFFTKALERRVASHCLTLDPEVISKVTEYCSGKLILSKRILNAVAETFVCQSEKFSPSQISELIEPFGKLNYLPPNAPAFFRKLENVLFTGFNHFPPKTLLRVLHACSLIEYHPVNFMPKIFSPFFLQQLQGEESYLDRLSLAQLTQLFLTSVLECPFYKGPKLLAKYRVKSFLTPYCSLETPVDFALYKYVVMALIDLLGGRMYFASKVLTPYCYTIDVEIKLDEEGFVLPFTANEDVNKRIALCIDGPKRFCSNSSHLLGKEAIKQRHLRLLGYQVVQVPYHEMEMLKSRLELVEYLQGKLFPQNPSVHW
ncbi:FAST kinase domain-containing protein 3 [Heterocephalus glaber]|uniref:FAST kinase domain-containing protein 3 n=1 Tax=Heterocephalus glaber TaxID=10181 RepID=G5AX03_HETGA|nr:FAST kinase domain-containing protein 3, mitochondrial isoform X2 [Heterocephalus glaber]EHB01564.1 FAST kinase domain-containing protein 3 [Heterocephalus glaber]